MALIKKIHSSSELYHDLKAMGRDNFSYEGAEALQEYLDELSDDIGEDIEYDPIAFCCDYAEYSTGEYESLADEYYDSPKRADYENNEEFEQALFEWLRDNTIVIEFNGGIIVQSF